MISLFAGTLIAFGALAYVLYPLFVNGRSPGICGNCGEKAERGARFCAHCGRAL